jgi:hypothetical protein
LKRYIKGDVAVRDDREFFVFRTEAGQKVETKALIVEEAKKNIENILQLKVVVE